MDNNYNKTSVCDMKFVHDNGGTVLKDYYFTSPFKIVKPFRTEYDYTRVMLMSSSGGIMSGDTQQITVDVGDNCKGEIISQSYEKIYKMLEGQATRTSNINIGSNAVLNYIPQPTIPYADSAFENTTNIYLKDSSSRLIYNEILSSGRVYHGEQFQYKFFKTLLNISEGGKLIYRDNTNYNPEMFKMDSFGMYEGYTHLANQVIVNFGDTKENIKKIREVLEASEVDMTYGVTNTEHGDIVVRILGYEGNSLEQVIREVVSVVI